MKPRLIVEQKITPFVNKYTVFQADKAGSKSDLLALAQQKRIAIKEKVIFYTDESKSAVAFGFRAEKVMDVHGRYFVEDTDGKQIGAFKKDFKRSLLSSTWHILDASGQPVIKVSESSKVLAAMRRFGGLIPFVGDVIEIITLFLRYHFVFSDAQTGEEIGRYQKTTLFRDHYVLSVTDEAYSKQDWRVFAAMAVGLDVLQSR